jgi:hypothetical protein
MCTNLSFSLFPPQLTNYNAAVGEDAGITQTQLNPLPQFAHAEIIRRNPEVASQELFLVCLRYAVSRLSTGLRLNERSSPPD